jgi:signal transduction histidine kinase
MGYIDLTLLDQSLSEQARRQLDVARKNTGRLLRLVNDLLLTAQTDQGHLALDRTLIDLATLVREAVQEVGARARNDGVRLEADLPELVRIQGDPLRLAQVVDNLLSNAVKYSLPGGLVQVSLTAGEADADGRSMAVLSITDEGIGISAEDQERLFTRFFRAQEATERAIQGAGLGLSICKSLVEAHDGTIEVDSAPGAGTTFRVRLPVSVDDGSGDQACGRNGDQAGADVPAADPAV